MLCSTIELTDEDSLVITNTVFGLTHEGWVMWACVMGLWTVIQGLLNVPQHEQED